jgi:hypothetical protein
MKPDSAQKSRPIDPFFRADSVVLAISVEKDGNLRAVYARIGRCHASTYSSSGPTMKRCFISNEVSRWKKPVARKPSGRTSSRSRKIVPRSAALNHLCLQG